MDTPPDPLQRLRALEALDALLPALAGVLDIRDVFDRVSAIAQQVLPHDGVVIGELIDDHTRVRMYASQGLGEAGKTTEVPVLDPALVERQWDVRVVEDLHEQPEYANSTIAKFQMRSALFVPIHVAGAMFGGLAFYSKERARFVTGDALIAKRIADHIALAVSHQRLADDARRQAEFQARADRLEERVQALTDELNARAGFHRVIGQSPAWRQVLTQATQVGATDTTVLLLGESGTGKEVVARFIHRASPRGKGPFVAINCAALPENLLEAELFGYERGAFTGAMASKPGQLELAAGGTLFLDEVAEMNPSAQAKLLRVLQEREFQRLGGTRLIRADARIVAATNRDLEAAMGRGQFREDLYYRLNVFAIALPRLRDRRDDIMPLSEAFLKDLARTLGRPPAGISQDARRALTDYHWPGNVRELRNMLERAAILADGGLVIAEHLAFRPAPARSERPAAPADSPAASRSASRDLKTVERELIEQAMQDARFNKSKAARALGLTRAQLYAKLGRYGIE